MKTPEDLPDTSFAALAFELRIYARREVLGNEAVEEFLARHPNELLQRTLGDLRESAILVGQAATVLAILSRHEAAVRALVAPKTPHDQTGDVDACLSRT